MLKQLLTFAAVAAMSLSASAYDLSLEATSAGWGSSYDPATHTITFEDSWTGQGWGWWEEPANFSAYTDVIIEMEPTTISAQLVVQYKADGTEVNETSGFCEVGAKKLKMALNDDLKGAVQQIYIQCGQTPGTLTLVSAQVVDNSGAEPDPVLWEGNYSASGWNAGATINKGQVKAGDILAYYMTPGSSESAQVIIKGSDWSNLIGTAKITNSAIIDGVVEVVVTDAMLEACGGTIFLQGDGGITCTKIEKVGKFEFEEGTYCLNHGRRIMPVESYTQIPESAKYVTVSLNARPEWIQLCNSGWTALLEYDQAVVTEQNENLVMVSFAVTPEIIAAINADSQLILNGDTNVIYYGLVASESLPTVEGQYTVGLEDNSTPWWSAWSKGLTLKGDGSMHYVFRNYSNGLENWNNWLLVLTNSGLTPNEGDIYGSDQELVVLRADNYGWGVLYDKTTLTNDYDWATFKTDMMNAHVVIDVVRSGSNVEMVAVIETADGKTYNYKANIEGVNSEILGSFLTVEGGHLEILEESVNESGSISGIINDADATPVYYNINGMIVNPANLPAGLYIIKQGSKTSKVIIR